MTDIIDNPKDDVERKFNKWWKSCYPSFAAYSQASDYAVAAYKAGYLMGIVMQANSAEPAKDVPIMEQFTRDNRDALVAAKEKEISAISNFCSTVLQVAGFHRSLQAAIYTPIKDRP